MQGVKTYLPDAKGKNILVFAQNTAFGQGNVAAIKLVFGPDGATIDQILVPQDAKDFAPFAQQVVSKKPDLVFVAWAGTTASSSPLQRSRYSSCGETCSAAATAEVSIRVEKVIWTDASSGTSAASLPGSLLPTRGSPPRQATPDRRSARCQRDAPRWAGSG